MPGTIFKKSVMIAVATVVAFFASQEWVIDALLMLIRGLFAVLGLSPSVESVGMIMTVLSIGAALILIWRAFHSKGGRILTVWVQVVGSVGALVLFHSHHWSWDIHDPYGVLAVSFTASWLFSLLVVDLAARRWLQEATCKVQEVHRSH